MKEVRLYISVSSCREWKTAFGSAFTGLIYHLTSRGVKDCKLTTVLPDISAQASLLSQARQCALSRALDGGYTHWLSLDDDMMFPPDVVDQLMAHDKSVVTANYRRKSVNHVVGVCMGLEGRIIDSTERTGIEQIGWMGGGCFLADLEKIKHVPKPHFEVVWSPERNDYFDQDYYFSSKLRQHGAEIWCDHDVSNQMVHVGDYHFKFPTEKDRQVIHLVKPRIIVDEVA